MNVLPYKTHKIQPNENLYTIFDTVLPKLEEKSVVVIASKIVGICEGRVVKKISDDQKDQLAKQEADYYLPREYNQYGFMMTINQNLLVASAGIDESNSNDYLSLWPKDPQKSVNEIREYLAKKHQVKYLGVILTDSKLTPLRWGVTGYAIVHSGFQAVNSYIGKPDIYGRLMHAEKSNIADALAAAAVVTMGEGNEQQPLAIITDLPFVTFQKRNPTKKELDELKIKLEDDVYASLLTSVKWKKGKQLGKNS
ncbi:MAG TPA: coenzyme F420-0:L-glutamate ligase [Methylomirabilota bacterium]|nr:coenzyme F420-0:L-glutamate ligase [Methylomirabilota bacterium]